LQKKKQLFAAFFFFKTLEQLPKSLTYINWSC